MTKKQMVCVVLVIAICGLLGAQETTETKKVSFDVNMGYVPLALFAQDSIGTTFSPAGAKLGFTVFFLHRSFGNMGAEIGANWAMTNTEPSENSLTTHIIPIHANYVYVYNFNERLALDSHLGLGMNMYNVQLQPSSKNPPLLELSFSLQVGTALQIALVKGFYTEVGVNYIVSFPRNLVIHQLNPALSFGYKF